MKKAKQHSLSSPSQHSATRFSWISIFGNAALFGAKLWAGIVSGSVTLLADAWHTLSDSISSIIVLVAIKVARKPPDEEHPFGHGRSQTVASVIVGSMLFFIAFHFCVESVHRLVAQQPAVYGKLAIWVTIISVVVKEAMARGSIYIGKKAQVSALVADGWHHRSDALSSILVLVGIFLNERFWWIDGIMGIGMAIFIAFVAYGVMKEAISALLGESPADSLLHQVQGICNATAGENVYAHQLHVHDYGGHVEVVFHIRLPQHWSLERVHDLVDDLEAAVEKQVEGRVTIHVDPLKDAENGAM